MGQIVIADKGFAGAEFEQQVAAVGARLLRPDRKHERRRFDSLAGVRQWIESYQKQWRPSLEHLATTGRVGRRGCQE